MKTIKKQPQSVAVASALQVGAPAPDFSLPSTDGKSVSLTGLKGQVVVLFFYPKDMTPGCTQEACDFRDQFSKFRSLGAAVYGISKDSLASHDKFRAKERLNFPLLSDVDGKVIESYGVWVEKSLYGRRYMGIERATVIIDRTGRVAEVYRQVKVADHVEAVLARVAQIAAA